MPIIKTRSFTLSVYEKGDPKSSKLALVLPGRLESKDYIHVRSHADTLAGLGFHAVAFDPPGSWKSSGDITQYTVTNYLAAVNELVEHYGNKPTLLVGHSLGGSIAMLAGATNPHVSGLILLMTAARPRKLDPDVEWQEQGFVRFNRDVPPGDRTGLEQQHYNLPYSYVKDAQQQPLSTTEAIQQCKQPKLFIFGQYDTNTLPEDVRQTFALAPEPKQLIGVPSYHGYRYSRAGIATINRLIREFVADPVKF